MRVAGDSSILPCKWLKAELPLILDQIRMSVATSSPLSDRTSSEHAVSVLHSVQMCSVKSKLPSVTDCLLTQSGSREAPAEGSGKEAAPSGMESVVQLSTAEAKQAWLTAGGDTERAARQALRDRLAKVIHVCTRWNTPPLSCLFTV